MFILFWLAQIASAAGIEQLRSMWDAAENPMTYAAVANRLIEYRLQEPYAKTAEIDYMIATSLCKIPGREADGYKYFEWILYSYDLGFDRKTVEQERQKCGAAGSPVKIAFATLPGQGGAAGVRSKLYYWIGREQAAINSEPVEIVDPKSEKELKGRIYPVDQVPLATEAVKQRMGGNYKVIGSHHFIMASKSNQTIKQLEAMAETLDAYLRFFISEYDMREPAGLVTVYLVPNTDDMQRIAIKLHGIKMPEFSIGYSFRDDLSIVGVIPKTYIGTLAHELAHLLIRDKYGDVPPWLDEGLASLYEVSVLSSKGKVIGQPNWRGCVLRRLWQERYAGLKTERPTIGRLVMMDWQSFNNLEGSFEAAQQAVNHATARYFMLYLQERGILKDTFASIARRSPMEIAGDPRQDALNRVKSILGSKDLDIADAAFEQWLIGMITKYRCQ